MMNHNHLLIPLVFLVIAAFYLELKQIDVEDSIAKSTIAPVDMHVAIIVITIYYKSMITLVIVALLDRQASINDGMASTQLAINGLVPLVEIVLVVLVIVLFVAIILGNVAEMVGHGSWHVL